MLKFNGNRYSQRNKIKSIEIIICLFRSFAGVRGKLIGNFRIFFSFTRHLSFCELFNFHRRLPFVVNKKNNNRRTGKI